MSKKIILTEGQRDLIVDQIINEMLKDVDSDHLLNDKQISEGIWTNIKYGLSKLGRWKVGGEFGGVRKKDQEAGAKIQKIIDNKANEAIAKLDAEIKQQNPEFPNNKEPVDFLNTVMSISAVYDSIVAATQKDPKDEKYLPIDAANGIINDLREYVKKFLDIDLAAAYSTLDEAEGNIIELTDEELKQLDEAWGLNEEGYSNEEIIDEDQAADVRKQLKAKRGAGADFQSDKMKNLKSNRLPMTLLGVGSALGGFSWLVNTDWFKSLFETVSTTTDVQTVNDVVTTKSQIVATVQPGDGLTQTLNKFFNANLSPNSTPEQLLDAIKTAGGGNLQDGIDAISAKGGMMGTPVEAKQVLIDIAKNPHGHGDNLGQIFQGKWSGTGKQIGDMLTTVPGGQLQAMIVKTIVTAVPKLVTTTAIKTGAAYGVAKGLGAVLGPIGVGLLATGALVKIMRMKGQKQSRAATLNDLYQSIRNIEGGTGIVKPEGETIDAGSAGDPKAIDQANKETEASKTGDTKTGAAGGTGGVNDDLYNSIRNLFQFLVNNKNKIGVRAGANVGTGGAVKSNPTPQQPKKSPLSDLSRFEESYSLSEGEYFKDKRLVQFLQKNLSVDKLKSFEDFIKRIEILRNKIKNIKTDDKVINGFISKLNSNPIMATNFKQLFNVSADNAQAVNALKAFIDDIFVSVYSGKYKFDSLIKKMGSAGGNFNKLEEEAGYNAKEPNKAFAKDAQDRGRFKGNLLKFLQELISMFSYLNKLKSQGKLGQQGGKQQAAGQQNGQQQATGQQGGEQQATGQPAANQPADNQADANEPADQQQAQSQEKEKPLKYSGVRLENKINNENKLLSEEINKINKLIGKIN